MKNVQYYMCFSFENWDLETHGIIEKLFNMVEPYTEKSGWQILPLPGRQFSQ